MRAVRSVLSSPFFAGGLAVILVGIAVWWIGDKLAIGSWRPFGSWVGQAVFVGALAAIWLILLAIWLWRRNRRNDRMVKAIAEPQRDPEAERISDEEQALDAKFTAALKDLAKLRFRSRLSGPRYLYELPWYIFIGPPGAGKTTALEKCGLDFPLKRGSGRISIDGGSGTRNCDWVFTNEAVFIDTAGRYTTQNDKAVDRSAWRKFLSLLVRHRPGEPINGVIVAISIGDLALATPGEIDAHAAEVRARLNELTEAMKARVPVYVMFTKADLLVGFNEYFQTLRKADREQVWGYTFPLKGGLDPMQRAAEDLAAVGEEYDRLLDRLGEMQFRHIQEEPDIETRAKIFGFASQFATLKPVVQRFLSETFRPDRFSEAMLLRGFYFTSATQIGQPVDRLISAMSREFGLERRVVGMMSSEGGRAYFLEGLLREVIFPEAGLVSNARRGRLAASAGRYAALAACVLLPVFLGLAWWTVRAHTEAQAASLTRALDEYSLSLVEVDVSPVADANLAGVLKPLNALRDEMLRLESDEADAPFLGLGMDQMGAIRAQARQAYAYALDDLLRPRLLYRIEGLLRSNLNRPELLYEILKTYLMLGGRGPLDEDYVRDQVGALIELDYPPATNRTIVEELRTHLDAILEFRPQDRSLDEEAIREARAAVSQISIAERALSILLNRPEARALEPWTLLRAGSDVTETVFARKSGKPLDEPIPGIFTYEGFYTIFNENAEAAAEAALSEKWLVESGVDPEEMDGREMERIRRDVRALYYQRYGDAWEALLNDIRIVPFTDAEHAGKMLNFLSGGTSPLRAVLQAAARNTALTRTPTEDSPLAKNLTKIIFHRAASRFNTATRLIEAGASGLERSEPEGAAVERRFEALIDYVGSEQSGSGLEALIGEIKDFYNVVDDMARADRSDFALLSETGAARKLRQSARGSAPPVVAAMIVDMIDNAGDTSDLSYRAGLNEVWASAVFPACQRLLHDRYPFGPGPEIAYRDLAEVLGPGGLIDRFFTERLQPLVRTEVKPWVWSRGRDIGIGADKLAFFETAAELRDAFFPPGAPPGQPSMSVGVIIEALSQDVEGAQFEIGGAGASFQKDRHEGVQLEWPGRLAANGVAVRVFRGSGFAGYGGDIEHSLPGPWGLFRLLDQVGYQIRHDGSAARVQVGPAGEAMFMLSFDSQVNPVSSLRTIRSFKCPGRL